MQNPPTVRGLIFPPILVLALTAACTLACPNAKAQQHAPTTTPQTTLSTLDAQLFEITVPQLESLYSSHSVTVTLVVGWYLDRIDRYNPVYRAVQTIDRDHALVRARALDAQLASGHLPDWPARGLLWGVPIVTKANTSVQGLITTDGWRGYMIPGHELVAPRDATIVARLRASGAVLLGQTNMPDFAASDTNRSTAYGRTGNAYDVRFSPGGSSGGTVTAVTSNYALLGNGTDTGNSIRMPSATSAVVGVFPTRGLVSIAGIAPLDWLLDNTGPIARTVTDAAIALTVMAGASPAPDPLDPRTADAPRLAQPGPYTQYLNPGALQGKRFGVPAFILQGSGIPFQGVPAAVPEAVAQAEEKDAELPLRPSTRAAFLAALDGLRAAGATIVFDDSILPPSFAPIISRAGTMPYVQEGTDNFLHNFGPSQYHSAADYLRVTGQPLPNTITNPTLQRKAEPPQQQRLIESDPAAKANYYGPRQAALDIYLETLDRMHLDGYVYPATQMPPPDETMPQDGARTGGISGTISEGPHSDTSWVNILGVPAIVVPGGFYPSGLPFGLEISARPWRDGDLLGWAFAYEQITHHRHPPLLVEQGLLPAAPKTR